MPETPEEPAKTKADETSTSFQMLTDFILRLAERVTRLESEVLELQQRAHVGEFAKDQDGEGES
jgi:hypothetical protein